MSATAVPSRSQPTVLRRGLFIITGLDAGGAEMMLLRLLAGLRQVYAPTVVSLQGQGYVGQELQGLGIPVYPLDWSAPSQSATAMNKLVKLIRTVRPDFVQGWMIHGNVAVLATYLAVGTHVPVLWNIRNSARLAGREKRSTTLAVKALAYLSSWPTRIIYNSRASAQEHEDLGYNARRTVVIPNGFDCTVLRPRAECRPVVRATLGLRADVPLVGIFARYHPIKDHNTFLRAARELVSKGSQAHFLVVGRGTTSAEMTQLIRDQDLEGRVHTLGERFDVLELMASVDIATCCSVSEAFPNTVGEAMACGVPCVVTDVGDSAFLVGASGRVVPARDPVALSTAWYEILNLSMASRRELGWNLRKRIVDNFSLESVVTRYDRLYSEILS